MHLPVGFRATILEKGEIMNFFLTLTALFMTFAEVFSQAEQKEFVIGAFWEPAMSGIVATDSMRLTTCKNGGFNTIIHSNSEDAANPTNANRYWNSYADTTGDGLRYLLERMQAVGGLRIMIADNRFQELVSVTYPQNRDYWLVDALTNARVTAITNDYGNITGEPNHINIDNDIILGYHIKDEPWPLIKTHGGSVNPVVDRVVPLMQALNANDADRIAFANLFPYNTVLGKGLYFANFSDYKTYVTNYMNSGATNVASFDYYPFYNGGWNTYAVAGGVTYYYRNLHLFATETVQRHMNFWAYPLAVEHFRYDAITEVNLRFVAHAPILYGAKGLVYFTYATPNGYHDAMITPDFTTTDIYTWAKTINTRLAKMGPTLMDLTWRETIHTVSPNPDSNEPVNIDNTTDVIRQNGISDSSFAVSVFEGKDKKNYLIAMNLDRVFAHSVTISCVDDVNAEKYVQATDKWNTIGGKFFTLNDIQPAGIELIRLDPAISPTIHGKDAKNAAQ